MFGECHGHIFMNGVDYHRAVALYAHGVDREDVKRKLQIYRNMGITFYRDGGDHVGASEYARSIAPEYGIDFRAPSMGYIKMDITGRLWDWDLIL